MLIRICDHFKDNPKRIDKLLAVKGLPEDWFFRDLPEGKELKKPWEPDIDKNIPLDIRHLCEPTYIVEKFAALEAGKTGVIQKRQILGVRIDYNSEPGRQVWDDVERYISESIPRDVRIPVPVLCARDERSAFDTYTPRRTSRGSLELVPAPVPFVDLTEYQKKELPPPAPPALVVLAPEPLQKQPIQDSEFKCDDCDYHHASQRGIRMHRMKKHPKKEEVKV